MGATMGKNGGTLLDSLPSTQGTLHIVMLGLDSAGKTTALYRLKFDQYLNTVPTIGFNCEKVRGAVGRAKGAQFLVWDVGGQEKLRPLWRSYTRCTDGIVFVVDSVDVERMEEAKMELMRTAKCPDNQGVPVLILANKQDLPGAGEPKELEKLLGLHELSPLYSITSSASSFHHSSGVSNQSAAAAAAAASTGGGGTGSGTPQTSSSTSSSSSSTTSSTSSSSSSTTTNSSSSSTSSSTNSSNSCQSQIGNSQQQQQQSQQPQPFKGWYIQPACAITGEGLQEGLEALYDMIIKRRKLNKACKKKR